jgi:1-acyl-sn-glycerol-3-phosphate acyltransferase
MRIQIARFYPMRERQIKKITKRGFIVRCVMVILKIFKKRPVIFNLNEILKDTAIFIANHNGASGPIEISLYLPKLFVPWGAHPMTENYRNRWNYLYHIFYRQKLKFGIFASFLLSTVFGLVSKLLYDGMNLIPAYPDIRVRKTLVMSLKHLECGNPVLIFPEDSIAGYQAAPHVYNSGFVALAQAYFNKSGTDLPVYPILFNPKKRALLIEKPIYIHEYVTKGCERAEIAEVVRIKTNEMVTHLEELLSK